MAQKTTYFDPETLAKIQGLSLRAQHIVEGYISGVHRSPFHGYSIEFAEHREYAPGDDLRYVDWKVFGKTDKYYVKQYEEETNLIAYLLLDTSESMAYRGPQASLSKLEYAKCLAASLAYLILQQQDSAGLATFAGQIHSLVRPSGNPSHLKQLLHVLEQATGAGKTATGPIFHDLAERLNKRGMVIVFSDLFDRPESLLAGLKHLRHRRHEVMVFQLLDPAELEFPFRQMTRFKGLEQLDDVLTDPQALREAYLNELQAFLKRVKVGCREQRVDYTLVRTDQPIDMVLTSVLAPRMSQAKL